MRAPTQCWAKKGLPDPKVRRKSRYTKKEINEVAQIVRQFVRRMKPVVKHSLLAVAGGLVLGLAVIFGTIVWVFTHADIDQSDGPVSRDKALQHCSLPIPSNAHDVEYASYAAGLQEGHFYVRFEAPVPDCFDTARTIFANHAKETPGYVIPEFQPVSHPEREKSSDLRIEWFDNDRISKGVTAGTGWSWEPRVWIDEERGIFYYEIND